MLRSMMVSSVAMLFIAGLAQAQTPSTNAPSTPPSTTATSGAAQIIFDGSMNRDCGCSDPSSLACPPSSSWLSRVKQHWRDKWDRKSENCDRRSCSYGKTLSDPGCGSWRLDTIFIFGSCHDFFEEPCRRQPPIPAPRRGNPYGW